MVTLIHLYAGAFEGLVGIDQIISSDLLKFYSLHVLLALSAEFVYFLLLNGYL